MSKKEQLFSYGREVVLKAPNLYIDIDAEADGIAGHGSMLAVGAQSVTGESYYTEIKPYSEDFIEANRQFCEAHGLEHERLLKEAPELAVAMTGLYNFAVDLKDKYQKDLVFTGFNAAFDFAHVDLAFLKTGLANPFGTAPFDLKSLAMELGYDWDFSATHKARLPEKIVPDGDFSHNALEDAQYQQKIHFAMAALHRMTEDHLYEVDNPYRR